MGLSSHPNETPGFDDSRKIVGKFNNRFHQITTQQQQQQRLQNLQLHTQQYEISHKAKQTQKNRRSAKVPVHQLSTKYDLQRNCNDSRRIKKNVMYRWMHLSIKTTMTQKRKKIRASSSIPLSSLKILKMIVKWMLLICLLGNVGNPNKKFNWFVMADQNAVLAKNAKYRSKDDSKFGMSDVTNSCQKKHHRPQLIVKNVYMVCDSPGAYYYGSDAYQNSSTCVYGDTAMVNIEFKIKKDFTGASSIIFILDSGIYDNWEHVLFIQGLCSNSGIVRMNDDDYVCPHPGNYELYTSYVVPAQQDVDLRYTPDIKFKFLSKNGRQLGCAVTGTIAMRRNADAKEKVGIFLMGTFLMMFLLIFGFLLVLSYRKKKRLQQEVESRGSAGFHLYPTSDAGINLNNRRGVTHTSKSETISTTSQHGGNGNNWNLEKERSER